jgi:hypothetical protein
MCTHPPARPPARCQVSQHPECVVSVKVLERTSSGEHKFKVVGVSMSEDPQHRSVSVCGCGCGGGGGGALGAC